MWQSGTGVDRLSVGGVLARCANMSGAARGGSSKEDEHRAIFDQATLCIRAADPFSALNRGHAAISQAKFSLERRSGILFKGLQELLLLQPW